MRVILGTVRTTAVIATTCGGGSGIEERGLATDCNPESNAPATA